MTRCKWTVCAEAEGWEWEWEFVQCGVEGVVRLACDVQHCSVVGWGVTVWATLIIVAWLCSVCMACVGVCLVLLSAVLCQFAVCRATDSVWCAGMLVWPPYVSFILPDLLRVQ